MIIAALIAAFVLGAVVGVWIGAECVAHNDGDQYNRP